MDWPSARRAFVRRRPHLRQRLRGRHLDVLTTGPLPLYVVAGVKCLAHWLTTGIPLVLLAPILGLLLNLHGGVIIARAPACLAGTPAVSFLAGIGANIARTPPWRTS
ncbi:MAG: heme exporter protein CcmB [Hyphomicrobiales bacterium]